MKKNKSQLSQSSQISWVRLQTISYTLYINHLSKFDKNQEEINNIKFKLIEKLFEA